MQLSAKSAINMTYNYNSQLGLQMSEHTNQLGVFYYGENMKYMGSKARIAKYILPIILKDRNEGQWYVEPFVGGANMIDKVNGNRIGSDVVPECISCLELIRGNLHSLPKDATEFNEERYKNRCVSSPWLSPYVAFALSFGGKLWGGFRRDSIGKRDYVAEAYNNSVKQSPLLSGVHLVCSTYEGLQIPNHSIIYCDPPYAGTTKYKDDFNHDEFWQWCREKCAEGHQVFISEYNAPDDFVCIWSKEIQSGLNTNTTKKGVERLFVHKSQQ